MSFVEGSANDWLSLAAVEGHGLDHGGAALVYATFVAAMTVGRLVGGPLVDRLGTTRVLLCCATVASIGLGVFIFAAGTPLIFAATALWGLGASLGFPVGMSLAADHPTDATKRVSMVSIFGYSASLAGPPALGVLAEHFGILHAFVLVLGFVVISLAVLPGTRKR
nr:MFS transporter [Pseudoclavibacter sp. 13-3]